MARAYQAVWRSVLAAVLVMGMLGVLTQGAAAAERDRLKAFLQVTGFDVALESIALSAESAPLMLGMEASDFGFHWTRITKEVFDKTKMHAMALDLLEKTLSDDLLTHAADFYASPLGMRLVEVENASHLVEDEEAKRKAGDLLVEEMTRNNPHRLAEIKRMNAAIDSGGHGVRAVQEIQVRFIMAANEAGVLRLKIDEKGLRARLRENEADLRQSMEKSALSGAAYTYKDSSDAEITAYADALEDKRMVEVYDLMNAIQWEIMANRFEALAAKMVGLDQGEEL
ncbi:DUF2059 domain-containing protein [Rhodobacteraceae bacterium D3-12]|nr:DUF2059 domain-containing protein [Rhodobacteraceae bacterium D3-12]